MKNNMKKIIFKYMPEDVVFFIKKRYYPYAIKRLSENIEPELSIIKKLVKKDDVVADVGANIGVYTKFLSNYVGEMGSVYSIEPVPYTFELLKNNINALKLMNVKLVNCAIGSENKTGKMIIPPYENGGFNYYRASLLKSPITPNEKYVKVEIKTLDTIIQDAITFVKCDVEGYEFNCISGARELILKHQPAWLIEITENPDDKNSTAFKVFKNMLENGYEPFLLKGNKLTKRKIGEHNVNYFFLLNKHLTKLTDINIF